MIKNILKNTVRIIKEMFCNLFNYGYKRSKHELIGFYLVYTLLIIVASAFTSGVASLFIPYGTSNEAEIVDKIQAMAEIVIPVVSCILSCVVLALIITSKNIYKEKKAIITTIITILVTLLFGAILGCIPLTIMTTFENKGYLKTEN